MCQAQKQYTDKQQEVAQKHGKNFYNWLKS